VTGTAAGPAASPAPAAVPVTPAHTAAAKAPLQVATAKPAPKAVEKPVEKPVVAAAGPGTSWYTGQAAGNYVVQIIGTSSEATAKGFTQQGSDYRYFKKTLQGKPLYVVTYGNFASRDAALAAIKNLPEKVQAGKPWARSVGSVQQELATAH
jgi:DamX protein